MKEYCGVAVNTMLFETNSGKFRGAGEVIIMHTEPEWTMGIDGVQRGRTSSTSRFNMRAKGMRDLATHLGEYADILDEMEGRANASAPPAPEAAKGADHG